MTQTVREFVNDSYRLISANSPTTPLHGNDQAKGIQFLNELIEYYSASGLLLTVPQEITFPLINGTQTVTFGDVGFDVNIGRLANVSDAWLLLQGVTYPLSEVMDNDFFMSYKYAPLLGLPLYFVIQPQVNSTTMIIYPGASQGYELHVYGKFQPAPLTANSTMAGFPLYSIRFFKLALAKDLMLYKSRVGAWNDQLEQAYLIAKREMEDTSQVNLNIQTPNENQLNGAYRVRAGV